MRLLFDKEIHKYESRLLREIINSKKLLNTGDSIRIFSVNCATLQR